MRMITKGLRKTTCTAFRSGFLMSLMVFAVQANAANYGDLDWRDRPRMAPYGGFFIQSRAGKQGNFEVVIAWPAGGLAHFFRDNDKPGADWGGPVIFGGNSHYTGASVVESGFATYPTKSLHNLDVVAISTLGAVEHWSRENGAALKWSLAEVLGGDGTGMPSLTYSGANILRTEFNIHLDSYSDNSLFLAYPKKAGGFEYW